MKRFQDRDGVEWEVVAGRESWGAVVALFVPTRDGPEIHQAPLLADGFSEATALLESMSVDALQELLDGASPKAL